MKNSGLRLLFFYVRQQAGALHMQRRIPRDGFFSHRVSGQYADNKFTRMMREPFVRWAATTAEAC
ncbi:hypothetical protein [Xanthomonas cassavae]|uniref:hypothetical protein n=1 Tax=Xanthomonas cassavae TaxID=56450 RepID=UPI0013640D35|nr:hypothetical protein [Xanthomonas cassavae]